MNVFSKINQVIFPGSKEYPRVGAGKMMLLGLQHAFAMSCATILVPLLTGLDVGVALFAAGLGTIIFHLCTGGRMPTFLGSSFAFIAALQAVIGSDPATQADNIPKALGGIIVAGLFYVVLSLLIRLFGGRFIDRLFPPVVRGVGIAIIGLNLAGSAINNIQGNGIELFSPTYYWSWGIALLVCLLAIILSSYGKGMVKMSSIVIALATGYVVTLILTKTGIAPVELMNFEGLAAQGKGLSLIHILKKGTKDIYLLHQTSKPAVLVECGFLSNEAEREKLKTADYQRQMALAIAAGLLDYGLE